MNNVCKCGKGYASEVDNLCKHCREDKYCRTRRECSLIGIRRGDGLSLYQLEEALKKQNVRYHYEQRGGVV